MGTEFQYTVNPLTESRRNISFTVGRLDDWDYLEGKKKEGDRRKSVVFIDFENSMNKLLQKESIESIKRTMLTHENIFKHQVEELHRLYNMQKILMNETRNEITKISEDHVLITKVDDLKKSVIDVKGEVSVQSVWIGSDTLTTEKAVNDEKHRQLANKMHNTNIYISTENNSNSKICTNKDGGGYEECDIDLTLGIGDQNKQMKMEGNKSSNQKSNLPHWLYQGLGSNQT